MIDRNLDVRMQRASEAATTQFRPARFVRRFAVFALCLLFVALAATCVIFVDEREAVIVERFGSIVRVYDREADRGAHFKLPWPIDLARRFDRRVQLFTPSAREMFTSDKKNVTVDVYVCWRIAQPPEEAAMRQPSAETATRQPPEDDASSSLERPVVRFYRGLGSGEVAEARLESRLRSILTTALGQVELSHLLAARNSEHGPAKNETGALERLSETVRDETIQRASETESLRDRLGIEIVDLRITRLNLPQGNQQAVFERMKSERKKIADRYRAAGLAENQMIHSQADRQYNELLAKTRADAERVRGAAEAEAVRVLNAAHAQDPEFYAVLAALDAYRKILNDRTTLVLSASSSMLKLLTEGIPQLKIRPEAPRSTARPPVAPDGKRLPSKGAPASTPSPTISGMPRSGMPEGGR
jgi:membrane protease subunit HflC